jgi:histidinol-phosphate/aromatic aminotransferase/cobyric acid decarboxylase-like protein
MIRWLLRWPAQVSLVAVLVVTALAASVVAGSGETVMLPTPWYFNHRMALEIAGIGCVPLPCEAQHGFVPDPERAAALWRDEVRALVLRARALQAKEAALKGELEQVRT